MTKTTKRALQWAILFTATALMALAALDMHQDRQEAACRVPYGRAR